MKFCKSAALFLSVAAAFSAFAKGPKYTILFIGDGMSVPQRMTADEFAKNAAGEGLVMNHMPFTATTRTCSFNSLVTDSAAAATAIACGEKTENGRSGTGPKDERLESCAEVAKAAGKKVGICSSVTITHATPAGFYAHRKSRGDAYGIAVDLANSGFDFFAGGGLDVNDKKSREHAEYAKCGDAYEYAKKKGYRLIEKKDEFLRLRPGCGKILTKFTNAALETAIDIDDKVRAAQPSLAEITSKAIEVLDNPNGFFLMVEGGRIDWAGHGNDAATNLRDVLALDEAVKVALAFQAKHSDECLVLVTGDHETGGMSMGFAGTGYALYMERLANQTMSVGKFKDRIGQSLKRNPKYSFEDAKKLMTEAFGFKFEGDVKVNPMVITKDELADLEKAWKADPKSLADAARVIMSHKCGIGWSSGAHTAMPVLTTAKGPCAEKFSGFIENTDISKCIKSFYR